MIWLILQALGALAGFAILAFILGVYLVGSARKFLRARHYCEFCWTKQANYLANWDDDCEPIGICDGCRAKKMGPLLTEQWLSNGKLVELGKVTK